VENGGGEKKFHQAPDVIRAGRGVSLGGSRMLWKRGLRKVGEKKQREGKVKKRL